MTDDAKLDKALAKYRMSGVSDEYDNCDDLTFRTQGPEAVMVTYQVSTRVNSPKNNDDKLIAPLEPDTD